MTNPDRTNPSHEVGAVSYDRTEGGPATAALTTGLVSFRKPDGLILSTGNLYFTSHDANFGTVWRMVRARSPGRKSYFTPSWARGSATSCSHRWAALSSATSLRYGGHRHDHAYPAGRRSRDGSSHADGRHRRLQ
jgi:hypothetical protein